MYSCEELFMRSLDCYFCAYFPRCCATREISTKLTLLWAHKQFATRVHTIFSMFSPRCYFNISTLREYLYVVSWPAALWQSLHPWWFVGLSSSVCVFNILYSYENDQSWSMCAITRWYRFCVYSYHLDNIDLIRSFATTVSTLCHGPPSYQIYIIN